MNKDYLLSSKSFLITRKILKTQLARESRYLRRNIDISKQNDIISFDYVTMIHSFSYKPFLIENKFAGVKMLNKDSAIGNFCIDFMSASQ